MLLSFRNEFAHGAFQANAKYIDEHFDILSSVFDEFDGSISNSHCLLSR